jgi:hypothetical protein
MGNIEPTQDRTVVLTVRADIDFHIFNEHVYVLNFGGSLQ